MQESPFELFNRWYSEAEFDQTFSRKHYCLKLFIQFFRFFFTKIVNYPELVDLTRPHIITLATATKEGRPKSRLVLFKGLIQEQFRFYTNYTSAKAHELEENPYVSIIFYFPLLLRQIRVEGKVERLPPEISDEYWATRPRDSQLAGMASKQSSVLKNYDHLLERFKELKTKHEGKKIPRPCFWGGYKITAHRIEFWRGKANRLHYRLNYRYENGQWKKEFLNP